jgi:hypothetical protein
MKKYIIGLTGILIAGCASPLRKPDFVDITPDSYTWNAEQDYKIQSAYLDSAGNVVQPECNYDGKTNRCYISESDFEKWKAASVRGAAAHSK